MDMTTVTRDTPQPHGRLVEPAPDQPAGKRSIESIPPKRNQRPDPHAACFPGGKRECCRRSPIAPIAPAPMTDAIAIHGHEIIDLGSTHPDDI